MKYIIEIVKRTKNGLSYGMVPVEAENKDQAKEAYKEAYKLKRMNGKLYSLDEYIRLNDDCIAISPEFKEIYEMRTDLAKNAEPIVVATIDYTNYKLRTVLQSW